MCLRMDSRKLIMRCMHSAQVDDGIVGKRQKWVDQPLPSFVLASCSLPLIPILLLGGVVELLLLYSLASLARPTIPSFCSTVVRGTDDLCKIHKKERKRTVVKTNGKSIGNGGARFSEGRSKRRLQRGARLLQLLPCWEFPSSLSEHGMGGELNRKGFSSV